MNKKTIAILILFSSFYTNITFSSFWKTLFCCCTSEPKIKPRQTINNDNYDATNNQNNTTSNQTSNSTNIPQNQQETIMTNYGFSNNYHRNNIHFSSNTSSPNNNSYTRPKTPEDTYFVSTMNQMNEMAAYTANEITIQNNND